MNVDYKKEFRFLVLGANGAGKTNLSQEATRFPLRDVLLDRVETNYRRLVHVDGQDIMFDVHDPSALDRELKDQWSLFMLAECNMADCIVLVCDLTRKDSLAELKPLVDGVLRARTSPIAPFVVVGNKSDAPPDQQTLTDTDLDAFAAQLGAPSIMVSTTTRDNVDEAFMLALQQAVRHDESQRAKARAKPQSGLRKLIARLFGE